MATLTMNPAIDIAYAVDCVRHTHKMRSDRESYDPGGGGINVSRVIARLGGTARAYYLAGGATGAAFDGLLEQHQMVRHRIDIKGSTRISTAVFEKQTGKEYRFVPAGPMILESEWQDCLTHLEALRCDYLVAAGSLPSGIPDDFYARILDIAKRQGIRLILDTSGAALRGALSEKGVFLVKPSAGELRSYVGLPLKTHDELAEAARDIVREGRAEYVAVTMGQEGAMLASATGVIRLPAAAVEAKSAVGAGDSFVAGMTIALAKLWDIETAFRYGIAAGSASVLTPGTDLCHLADVERIYKSMVQAVNS